MNLTQEIQSAIAKSLPQETAGELKKYLEQAEINASLLQDAQNLNETFANRITELEKKEQKFNSAVKLLALGESKLKEASEKERDAVIELLKKDLAAEVRVSSSFKEFLTLLVKNPRSIEFMQNTNYEQQAGYSTPQGYVTPGSITKTLNNATERIETKESGPAQYMTQP